MSNKLLIVIVGPTGVGKTAMAIELARNYGAEIISADSRQVYREMTIGTAKPTEQELAAATHHLIDSHGIEEVFDAGKFAESAETVLQSMFSRGDVAIMVGGSGLYVKAYCEGLDHMPQVPEEIRDELNLNYKSNGLEFLIDELQQKDPSYYDQVDRKNPQRVIRALEVIRFTGKTYTSYRKAEQTKSHAHKIIKIGLEMVREKLYKRIDDRMDQMITSGLFDEAKSLYPHRHFNALQTVGYQEIFDFMDEKYDKKEAVRLLKRNSRRYAKRQMTWFKKDQEVTWFQPDQCSEIISFIDNKRE